MEVAANHSESVHVLRHSFRPSEHLAVALENYTEPGVAHPRSLLYATRLITLSAARHPHHEINGDYEMVNRTFVKRHNERVLLGREKPEVVGEAKQVHVVAKRLGKNVLRVGFLPSNQEMFESLLSGFDGLPNDIESFNGRQVKYYLHTDIQARTSFDEGRIAANTQVIAEELNVIERARMFYATPSAVDWRQIPVSDALPVLKSRE